MVSREVTAVAHYGWRDWLIQRVTAVVMLVYTLFLLAVLVQLPALDYDHWSRLWQLPVMRYATLLFALKYLPAPKQHNFNAPPAQLQDQSHQCPAQP